MATKQQKDFVRIIWTNPKRPSELLVVELRSFKKDGLKFCVIYHRADTLYQLVFNVETMQEIQYKLFNAITLLKETETL